MLILYNFHIIIFLKIKNIIITQPNLLKND
jgi:hypothetical protein